MTYNRSVSQIEYTVGRSRRRLSSAAITVGPKGVAVSAPIWMPLWMINNFIEKKRDWIETQLKKYTGVFSIAQKLYQSGEEYYFLGNKVTLSVVEIEEPIRTMVSLEENYLKVTISIHIIGEKKRDEIRKSISRWYLENGAAHITEKVNRFTNILNVNYSKITIKKVSSIWGSCSAKNNLNFNQQLIMAPHEIIDYVVIHEVCHLVHRDHSSRFWSLVRSLDPEYKQHRLWLRRNRELLSF